MVVGLGWYIVEVGHGRIMSWGSGVIMVIVDGHGLYIVIHVI